MTHPDKRRRRMTMANMVALNNPIEKVAWEFGVCLATVRNACREHRVKVGAWRRQMMKPMELSRRSE